LTCDLADPSLKSGRVEEKQGKKNPGVTRRPSKIRSKTRLQPVDFYFDDVILIFFKN
jgi:hypothetical protein